MVSQSFGLKTLFPSAVPPPTLSSTLPPPPLLRVCCCCGVRQTSTRLETLGEVYEHQAGLIKKLSKGIVRLRSVREDNEERLEEINNVADEQRVILCI